MLYAAKSHIGLVRTMNQDGFSILPGLAAGELYLVADGMGGPQAGDVASQLAIERVGLYVREHLRPDSDPGEVLLSALAVANAAIYQQACENASYRGMGTTIVCAFAKPGAMYIAHVGDSRAYMLSGSEFSQVTDDHSLVAELVRRGQLTQEEAKHHPQRNIVTRSLGTEPHSFPDVNSFPWRPDDVVLLCSDGLTNLVTDSEIRSFLEEARTAATVEDLEQVVEAMIQAALSRGGTDNVTALVAVNREEAGNK
ncbi:protein phosphatase [Alicyclobacillus sacchari]|uniref:Protein phosphatase n=1 Tax=Alicyclobacillus sacchari TaxID=392010 RepID=A0A4R8LPX0_9BACL|nr:Stp1/IreP family PP2C-type Ser/Thr phosphatase [Alicyclobacillus sacchari]TDY46614.1 protein phosphatase [Alicyclobacillus sacchari]GMA58848.1 protein phosphatase PrpC [Alicyclobacillus sacchari]